MLTFLALIYIARASTKANRKDSQYSERCASLLLAKRASTGLGSADGNWFRGDRQSIMVRIVQRSSFPVSIVTVIPKSIYEQR